MKMLLLHLILLCTTASALGQNTSNETVFKQALQNCVNSTFNATFYNSQNRTIFKQALQNCVNLAFNVTSNNSQESKKFSAGFYYKIKKSNLPKSQKFQAAVHVNSSSTNRFPNSTISQQAFQKHPNSAFNATSNNSEESGNISANFTRFIERSNQSKSQKLKTAAQVNSDSANRFPNSTISQQAPRKYPNLAFNATS